MNILAPFDSAQEVAPLIKAGASGLYCGFRNEFWQKKQSFTNIKVGVYGNITNFSELKESVDIANTYDVPVFFCANMFVADGAFNCMFDDIKQALALGVKGVVVVDLSIVPLIKKISPDCQIILSSKEPSLNKEHIWFFKELGVDSIFLSPRNMTVQEIEELLREVKIAGLNLEMFINDIGCRNITSMCLYRCFGMRGFYKKYVREFLRVKRELLRYFAKIFPILVRNKMYGEFLYPYEMFPYPCHDHYSTSIYHRKNDKYGLEKYIPDLTPSCKFCLPYCGLCDVYLFKQFNIRSIKLAGRGTPTPRKIKAVQLVKRYLDQIESGEISDHNFLEKGQELYKAFFGRNCKQSQCYHPISNIERKTHG